ncbi:MAG: hypothetical protein ACI97A_001487 [Planctomycetota bacterium]|jgi:hypothetical protein
MKTHAIPACALVFFLSISLLGQEKSKSPYLDSDTLNQTIRGIVKAQTDQKVRLLSIGKTLEGRDILGLELGMTTTPLSSPLPPNLEPRRAWQSGLLVASGLESDSLVGSAVLMAMAQHLLDLPAKEFETLFASRKLLIIPRVDHDGTERYFRFKQGYQEPGNARPIDWDRDGRAAHEDAPQDLNKDGLVTLMRQRHPNGTWIDDPDHPGRIRLAKVDEGELGIYRVFPESLDQDDDGEFGENSHAGVRLDQNFSHGFKEHDATSGAHAMSEPATRSLANFVLSRPWIENVLVYGTHDNIHTLPKAGKEKQPSSRRGRSPVSKHHAEDIKILKLIHEVAKKNKSAAASRQQTVPGSLEDWTYFQLGLPSAAINLWDQGVVTKGDKKEADDDTKATSQPSKSSQPTSSPTPLVAPYLPWSTVSHPTLGEVEVGGWLPFARNNPKQTEIPKLTTKQFPLIKLMLGHRAQLELTEISCKKLADALFEVECWVVNKGSLPSQTEQSTRCRTSRPDFLMLDLDQKKILQGTRLNRLAVLDARSGRKHFRWLLTGNTGQSLRIHLAPSRCAPLTKEITLP